MTRQALAQFGLGDALNLAQQLMRDFAKLIRPQDPKLTPPTAHECPKSTARIASFSAEYISDA